MVTIRFNNVRIDLQSKTTYSVVQKTDKKTGEVRYAIFFNLIGGGYREFIAFKTREEAEYIANIIDGIESGSSLRVLSGMDVSKYWYCFVFAKETGLIIHRPYVGDHIMTTDVKNKLCLLDTDFIDITPTVNDMGFVPVNIKECD